MWGEGLALAPLLWGWPWRFWHIPEASGSRWSVHLEGPFRLLPAATNQGVLEWRAEGRRGLWAGQGVGSGLGPRLPSGWEKHLLSLGCVPSTTLSGPVGNCGRSCHWSLGSRDQPAEAAHSGSRWSASAQAWIAGGGPGPRCLCCTGRDLGVGEPNVPPLSCALPVGAGGGG